VLPSCAVVSSNINFRLWSRNRHESEETVLNATRHMPLPSSGPACFALLPILPLLSLAGPAPPCLRTFSISNSLLLTLFQRSRNIYWFVAYAHSEKLIFVSPAFIPEHCFLFRTLFERTGRRAFGRTDVAGCAGRWRTGGRPGPSRSCPVRACWGMDAARVSGHICFIERPVSSGGTSGTCTDGVKMSQVTL